MRACTKHAEENCPALASVSVKLYGEVQKHGSRQHEDGRTMANTHRQHGSNTRELLHAEIRRHLTQSMNYSTDMCLATRHLCWLLAALSRRRIAICVWRKLTEPQTPHGPAGMQQQAKECSRGLSGHVMMVPGFEREFPHTGLRPSALRSASYGPTGGPSVAKRGAGTSRSRPYEE